MLQRRDFYSKKNAFFCSDVRFWAFSASKCVMRLLQQNGNDDAGCAYLRKIKQRAVPAPFSPLWQPLLRMVTPGGCDVLRAIFGGILRGKCCVINPTKSNALRAYFFCSKKRHIKSIIFYMENAIKSGKL